MNKFKTPDEIQCEINTHIDSLPLVKPEALLVGDSFVISFKNYRRVCGSVNVGHWSVLSKAKTLIRFGMCGDTENTVTMTETFKGAARDHTILRRATTEDIQKIKALMDTKSDAIMGIERRRHRDKDCYVLWNYAYENEGPEAIGDIAYRSREGFVLEVYDGNGQLHERVRMLSDSDSGLGCADCDAFERMVRAYAASYFNRENIKKNAKFHIQQIPEID
jgi:hypothetical protein